MNNKFIFLIVIIVIIVGIYFWQTPTQLTTIQTPTSTISNNLQDITFSALVKGCAETDNGMETKSFIEKKEQEAKIEVNGNEIIYSRSLNHLCCRKAEIQKEVIGNVINIYEIWSGVGCRCMCFSEIGAKLENIPSGIYIINVYENGVKHGDGNELMEEKLIIFEEITV